MIKIQGFGFPFDVDTSSCSTLTPKNFLWSKEKQNIQIYIDGAILDGIKNEYHEKKYAWICESKSIGMAKRVREELLQNKKKIYQNINICLLVIKNYVK